MKWLRYSLWLIGVASVLLWLVHRPMPQTIRESSEAVAQPLPPAAYPDGFEQQLSRLAEVDISLHALEELPQQLPWTQEQPAPPVGSPQARKGGTLRLSNVGPFPANFLAFGSPTPQFFHYNLFERIVVPLVWEHPGTGQEMAGLAEAWCVQGESVYFRLNPKARYSNGRPVRAKDFALGVLLRHKVGIRLPIRKLRIYGDSVLEVIPEGRGVAPLLSLGRLIPPAEPGFYAEFCGNYAEHYAHRIPPTTGAYQIAKIQRGRLIVLEHVPDWWAAELQGFRHTHNIDRIEHHFLTDEAQTWEMFLNGRLDMLQTRNVTAWEIKMDGVAAAEDGRISLHSLRINCPMPPYGIAVNAQTLPDRELRRGLMHALDMQRVTDVLFRGYAERLRQFTTGYRHLTHQTPLCDYNPAEARDCFARAGYTHTGTDGILQNADGQRLSIRFSFSPSDKLNTIATLLAQNAAVCGVEIIPEPLPWQNLSSQIQNGSHELTFWATMPGLPLPDYRRFFHSTATGHDAPFHLHLAEMDEAIEEVEQARTWEEAAEACARVDNLIHREGIWLPAWMENRANIATWKHIRLPENYAGPYDVAESHQLWIEH